MISKQAARTCNFFQTTAKEAMRKSPADNLIESPDEQKLSALMRKTQAGDQSAYRQLLERIIVLARANVQNSLKRMGIPNPASAEDVVQEILLAIHAKRDTYDPSQFFLPWFYSIVRYKVIDHARRLRRQKTEPLLNDESILDEVTLRDLKSDEMDIAVLLEKLPSKQRQILTLVKLDGLSLEEVSIQTGFSLSDVKVSVHRAIQTLKKILKEAESGNR